MVTENPVPAIRKVYMYVFDKALTANQILTDNIKISSDHDFYVTIINVSQTNGFKLIIRDSGTNRQWWDTYINSANLLGTAQYPNFLPRPRYVPAGSTVFFDMQDDGSGTTMQIALIGYQSPISR